MLYICLVAHDSITRSEGVLKPFRPLFLYTCLTDVKPVKSKTCIYKSCNNPVWSKGRCKWHPLEKPAPQKRSKLSPVGDKRLEELKEYRRRRRAFLQANPVCKVDGCSNKATDVHHMAGRVGRFFLATAYWLAACRWCHRKIEENPAWAKENGYSASRLAA